MFIRVLTDMDIERIINTDKIISISKGNGNVGRSDTIISVEGIDITVVSPSYEELATKLIEEQNEKRNFIEYTIDKTLGKLENTIVNAMRYAMNVELNKAVDTAYPVLPLLPQDDESYPDYLKRLENFSKGGSI